MAALTLPYQNGVVANSNSSSADAVASKKSRESERRRHRRKPKKNNKASEGPAPNTAKESEEAKENTDPKQFVEQVEIEYVPEKADGKYAWKSYGNGLSKLSMFLNVEFGVDNSRKSSGLHAVRGS